MLSISDLPGDLVGRFEGRDHGAKVSFFIGLFPPGTGPGLHVHPYDETFILEEGGATFTVGDDTIDACGGHILVVPANTPHRFVASEPDGFRLVSIAPSDHMEQEFLEG